MANRWVDVPRSRFPGWLERFDARHPGVGVESATTGTLVLTATDDTRAEIVVPFPPLPLIAGTDPLATLLDHVGRDRRIGVLLARKGGWAVGVFAGERLLNSKVGSSYVQGSTKAGGWSQQRYARRRSNQAQQSADRAAEVCLTLLLPELDDLDAVVTGGHRTAVDQVLADPRLSGLRALVHGETLPTPDPRQRVLEAFGTQALSVRIGLTP